LGDLTLHGVTHQVSLPATLTHLGDTLHIRTTFPVNVKDYQVGGLSKFLGIFKMDEHISVHVDLLFAPADAATALAACNADGGSAS
jgi:polyisoprenoid-binding protein YceI